MKIKRFENLWLMGLILSASILGVIYILKIFFPQFVIEVAQIDCEKLCHTCYSFAIQEVLGGLPIHCEGMSVGEFADKHPIGIYLIRIKGHLTTLQDGVCYDLWNCLDRECDLAWQMR